MDVEINGRVQSINVASIEMVNITYLMNNAYRKYDRNCASE